MVDHPAEPARARVSGYDAGVDGALRVGLRPRQDDRLSRRRGRRGRRGRPDITLRGGAARPCSWRSITVGKRPHIIANSATGPAAGARRRERPHRQPCSSAEGGAGASWLPANAHRPCGRSAAARLPDDGWLHPSPSSSLGSGRQTVPIGQQRPPAGRSRPTSRLPCSRSRVAPIADGRADAPACRAAGMLMQSLRSVEVQAQLRKPTRCDRDVAPRRSPTPQRPWPTNALVSDTA